VTSSFFREFFVLRRRGGFIEEGDLRTYASLIEAGEEIADFCVK
jgi:hypothetical protein